MAVSNTFYPVKHQFTSSIWTDNREVSIIDTLFEKTIGET